MFVCPNVDLPPGDRKKVIEKSGREQKGSRGGGWKRESGKWMEGMLENLVCGKECSG